MKSGMERGTTAFKEALQKRATLNNWEVVTVNKLRYFYIWKWVHNLGKNNPKDNKPPVFLTLSDSDVEALALCMEKNVMMAVIVSAVALMNELLDINDALRRDGPRPPLRYANARDAVEALRPGAAGGRDAVGHLRDVRLWDELYRVRARWRFGPGEVNGLVHSLTAREAMAVIQAVQKNIFELGEDTHRKRWARIKFPKEQKRACF